MNTGLKTLVISGLVAGSLMLSTGAAMAAEHDHWYHPRYDRESRYDVRRDHQNLGYWREKLDYDLSHHASRKRIAEDQSAIQSIFGDRHNDYGYFFRR